MRALLATVVWVLLFVASAHSADLICLRKWVQRYEEIRASVNATLATDHRWGVDGPGSPHYVSYETTFGAYLRGHRSFDHLFRSRRISGRRVDVVDLFGSGVFLSDPEAVDSITGVRLSWRKHLPMDPALDAKRRLVLGDLYESETWRDLQNDLAQRGITPNYIFMRPLGAILHASSSSLTRAQTIEMDNRFYEILIDRAYGMLSREGGELFVELPEEAHVNRWIAAQTAHGIHVDSGPRTRFIHVIRHPDSPAHIFMQPLLQWPRGN